MQGLTGLYFSLAGLLLLWMIAGYTLFHAGMVRSNNVVSVITQNCTSFAVSFVLYLSLGYNIIYHAGLLSDVVPSVHLLWHGKTALARFIDAPLNPDLMGELFFLTMAATLVMPIVIGAAAERIKLVALVLFAAAMSAVIYPVASFWVGPHGFLSRMGFEDVAGASTIQVVGAMAALAALLLIGPRKNRFDAQGRTLAIPGSNMALATLGTFMIWLGFLALNSGGQLLTPKTPLVGGIAWVMMTSTLAACASLFVSLVLVRFIYGKADLSFVLNGMLVGLVAISGGPIVNLTGALIVGSIAGGLMVFVAILLEKLKIDDPIGAIPVFGAGGFWGVLAVAFTQQHHSFAELYIANWSWHHQMWIQLAGFSVIAVWSFFASFIFFWIIRAVMGLRIKGAIEDKGLDIADHGMVAYPEFVISSKR